MSRDAPSTARFFTSVRQILYWIYAGRLTVALAVCGSAILVGQDLLVLPARMGAPTARVLGLVTLVVVALVTAASYALSHRRETEPGTPFLAVQAAIDVALVTVIVLVTGGSDSVFPPLLYVALVSGYALVTSVSGGLLIALVSGASYLAAISLFLPQQSGPGILLQALIFTIVAFVTGLIGGRLRQVGRRLSSLERELDRLRIGTSDILGTIEAAVASVDREGHAVYLNPAAAELFGLDPEAWIGRPVLEALGERARGVAEGLRETLERGEPVRSRDLDIEHPEHGTMPHSLSTALLEREGAPTAATAVLQDLRLARQLEELHLRASRLQVVAELSASLAHEIKNPLSSIRSACEQIADPDFEEEDRRRLSTLVVRETDRLSRLLGEFNDFARVDVAERVPIDLDRLVREAVAVVAERPEATDRASFQIDVARGLDDLWGDPDLVHRTLTNLLLNAVQVSDPNGTVTVRVIADALRPERSAFLASGMPVRIRVIDDGPGIPPEDMHRVFDPFYTRREGGSGMGLAIAHRAVQAHGGALFVSSKPGRGATFAVVLPRREPETRSVFAESGLPEELDRTPRGSPESSEDHEPSATLDGFADRLA